MKLKNILQEKRNYEFYSISPSSLHDCGRSLTYKYLNIEPSDPPSLESMINMESGNRLHEMFVSMLDDVIETELIHEVEKFGFVFRYKLDAVTLENNTKIINEIKTVKDYQFNKIYSTRLDTINHVRQLQLYLILEDLNQGRLIYFNRNDGMWFAYDFFRNNMKFNIIKKDLANNTPVVGWKDTFPLEFIIQHHKQIELAVEQGELFKREYTLNVKKYNDMLLFKYQNNGISYNSDWQCRYCSYKTKCWKLDEFNKSHYTTLSEFMHHEK
ncbi:MAG: hypothetical protein EOL88_06415 [Bacteroidia bacterium]|nr:hypothetical protein [Bacteroidia bacterium]